MATKRKYYNFCFNPFQLENHKRKPLKNLRPVLPTMMRKLNMKDVSISADMRVCDYCRLRIGKMRGPDTSETISDRSPENPQTSKRRKVKEEIAMEDNEMTREPDIIEKLKEAFHATNDRSSKIEILTIFKNWSSSKIHENFDVTDRMIDVAKKTAEEYGILSTPNTKTSKKLDEATMKHIADFYTSDDISRAMEGEKNCVPVRENGKKVYKHKRLMLSDLKETHRLFEEKYPDLKIDCTKFYESRPRHCVFSRTNGIHPICVCSIHENMKLMLDGISLAQLTANASQPLTNYKDCLTRMMCNPPSSNCHLMKCTSCPGTANLLEQLEDLLETELRDTVTYQQWIPLDQIDLETFHTPVEEFLEKLGEQLEKLITHEFIARQQSDFFLKRKEELKQGECLVVCDFVENHKFVIRDKTQGTHWNDGQVTIHPFVAYYSEDKTIKHKNYVAISESLKHDATAIHLFRRSFVSFLNREIGQVSRIIYFSDGANGGYKNKRNFTNLCFHEDDFGVSAEWHFFANSHGEGPCHAIGEDLKRLATKSSLEPSQEPIDTPLKFFSLAENNKNIQNVNLQFFTRDDYEAEAAALQARFDETKLIPKMMTFHSVQPISNNEITAKEYSNAQESVTILVCE